MKAVDNVEMRWYCLLVIDIGCIGAVGLVNNIEFPGLVRFQLGKTLALWEIFHKTAQLCMSKCTNMRVFTCGEFETTNRSGGEMSMVMKQAQNFIGGLTRRHKPVVAPASAGTPTARESGSKERTSLVGQIEVGSGLVSRQSLRTTAPASLVGGTMFSKYYLQQIANMAGEDDLD